MHPSPIDQPAQRVVLGAINEQIHEAIPEQVEPPRYGNPPEPSYATEFEQAAVKIPMADRGLRKYEKRMGGHKSAASWALDILEQGGMPISPHMIMERILEQDPGAFDHLKRPATNLSGALNFLMNRGKIRRPSTGLYTLNR